MLSIVCLVTGSLLFLLVRPYKDSSWLNIWDSRLLSIIAFAVLCITYTEYVALVPFEIVEVIAILPFIYLIIVVTYKLLTWMRALWICKRNQLILESQEPDRLVHPEEYGCGEEVNLLAPDGQARNESPQDPVRETYPACGHSQQKYGSV